MTSTELRGHTTHELKVYKPQVHLDIRKHFFSVRIVDVWNGLPSALLRCNNVEILKENSSVVLRIGDTNKLSASFPL